MAAKKKRSVRRRSVRGSLGAYGPRQLPSDSEFLADIERHNSYIVRSSEYAVQFANLALRGPRTCEQKVYYAIKALKELGGIESQLYTGGTGSGDASAQAIENIQGIGKKMRRVIAKCAGFNEDSFADL